MGLFQKAIETYDTHRALVGKMDAATNEPLAPCSHIVTSANLEITLDAQGKLLAAQKRDKDAPKIIIPVTERSAGRTSGVEPHPLCEQLKYLMPANPDHYQKYVQQLQAWRDSPYTHPKLDAVLQYVQGCTAVEDLLRWDCIKLDQTGAPANDKLLIGWRVILPDAHESDACWEDQSLFETWDAYYRAQRKAQGEEPVLCMVTGEWTESAKQHLKGVVSFHGNAKLISDNDHTYFTYRGRVADSWQVETVGYEASQKAHNALHWLAANQGVRREERLFLCWSPQGAKLPKLSSPLVSRKKEDKPITPSNYQKQLREALNGWKNDLPVQNAEAVIAVLDAATTGRLSLTYYNQLSASDFLDRLYEWDRTCCWSTYKGPGSPSILQIVNNAYGTQRTDGKIRMETDKKLYAQQLQRLMTCRVDQAHIPLDVVQALFHRACNLIGYDSSLRMGILFTACAVIRKYYYDTQKEEWPMALEPEKKDRSYQFGRLFALLEKAERDTYSKNGEDEKREPNAIRVQLTFSQRPLYMSNLLWQQIESVYLPQLEPRSRTFYRREFNQIMEVLSEFPTKELNRPLKETYLLGCSLQRNELYKSKEAKQEEKNNGSTEE